MQLETTGTLNMRELISELARNCLLLRDAVPEGAERTRFEQLAKITFHRATMAVDIYEEAPFRERPAIGAMYAACDVALQLVERFERIVATEASRERLAFAIRDLRTLIRELFEWVVVPNGEPLFEVEG